MDNKKSFGDFISQKRKEAGLTQKSFAKKIYVTESAVSKWERGLSYPDITLIGDICETLGVSEHELLTASEDTQTRTNEKLANQYIKLIRRYKRILTGLYGITLLICFISNLAAQHTLSWFYIVFASLLTAASITLLPVFIKNKRGLITLAGFTLSTLLLLLVCNIYNSGNWFMITAVSTMFIICAVFMPYVLDNIWLPRLLQNHKAVICMAVDTIWTFITMIVLIRQFDVLPQWVYLTAFWLIIPWGMLFIIRYSKINGYYKAAACIGLSNLVWFLIDGITQTVISGGSLYFGRMFSMDVWKESTIEAKVVFFSLLGLALAFAVAGIVVDVRKDKHENSSTG